MDCRPRLCTLPRSSCAKSICDVTQINDQILGSMKRLHFFAESIKNYYLTTKRTKETKDSENYLHFNFLISCPWQPSWCNLRFLLGSRPELLDESVFLSVASDLLCGYRRRACD